VSAPDGESWHKHTKIAITQRQEFTSWIVASSHISCTTKSKILYCTRFVRVSFPLSWKLGKLSTSRPASECSTRADSDVSSDSEPGSPRRLHASELHACGHLTRKPGCVFIFDWDDTFFANFRHSKSTAPLEQTTNNNRAAVSRKID